MEFALAKEFLTILTLGFIIGLQRELSFFYDNKRVYMGARTFAIIALCGYLSAKLYQKYPEILLISSIVIALFVAIFYILNRLKDPKERGNTTEFSAFLTFIIGILTFEMFEFAIFTTVMLIAILELKPKILTIKEEIRTKDVRATTLFLLMTFVVLPILPNEPIDNYGVINPSHIWMMVILISGLSFLGYLATRFIDTSKGLILIGFFGGLASSTAITLTLSKKATKEREANKSLAIAIALASSTMFIRVIIWTFILNQELFQKSLIPYLLTTAVGYLLIYILYKNTDNREVSEQISFKNPLEFKEALKIGVIFGLIFGILSLIKDYFGSFGVYIASFLSGFSDVDAIVLSLGELLNSSDILLDTATLGVILASIANTITKVIISFTIGNRYLGLYLTYIFSISLTVLVLSYYFLN